MRLCLLLFLSTVVYAVTRIVEPDFEGVNFAAPLFGKRLDMVFQETAVDSETSCQIQCLKNIRCLSYNLGTTNEKGNFTCQLSDSDRFTSHEKFTQDEKWLYRGMEVIKPRSWKKIYFFLLPCNSFFPNSKQSGNGRFKYGYTGSLSTLSDLTYCRDRKPIVSDPEHVLYDLLPQQRHRGGLRDGCQNFILPKLCTERFKNSFINRCLFQFI